MKTTEIFVEQVLIGAMVLLVAALLLGDGVNDVAGRTPVAVAIGLIGLGAAYVVGIVYDRVADSMLEGIEGRSRLWEALRIIDRRTLERRAGDPLPEERLRLLIQDRSKTVSDYADYLRTRMRLARALATLAPALAIAVAMNDPFTGSRADAVSRACAVHLVLVAYGAMFAFPAARALAERCGDKRLLEGKKKEEETKQPVTGPTSSAVAAPGRSQDWTWTRCLLAKPPRSYESEDEIKRYLRAFRPAYEPGYLVLSGFSAAALLIVPREGRAVVIAGVLVALLAGWAWVRIAKTHWRLLKAFETHAPSDRP